MGLFLIDQTSESVAPAALGVVFASVVVAFWPWGLDQFLLPKQSVLLLGVALLWTALAIQRSKVSSFVDRTMAMLVVVFTAWSVIAPYPGAPNTILHAFGSGQALLWCALFFVSARVRSRSSPTGEKRLLLLVGTPGVAVALMALAQAWGVDPLSVFLDLRSSRVGRWQVLTTLGNPTWTGEIIACCLPFLLAWFQQETARPFLRVGAVAVSIAGVAVTGSRGGLIALVVGFAWYQVSSSRSVGEIARFRNVWVSGTLLVVLGIGLMATTRPGRMLELEPLTGRLALWSAAGHLVSEAPVTGHGLGHSPIVLAEGLREVVSSTEATKHGWLPTTLVDRFDNDWLQVAVERGIPATCILIMLVAWTWARLKRKSREVDSPLDRASFASLVALMTCSAFSAPLFTHATSCLFWMIIGLAAAIPGVVKRPKHTRMVAVVAAAATIGALVLTAQTFIANSLAGRGHRALVSGRTQSADALLSQALDHLPWLSRASIDRAQALLFRGQPAEALVVIDDASRWAQSEKLWSLKAMALNRIGLSEQSHHVLEEGLAVLPHSPVLHDTIRNLEDSGSLVPNTTDDS